MATTITYKGSVIATATNSTKTLNTQGKYMEGNVIITDSTASISLQSKGATPSESAQTVVPDSGYDGLSSVSISAIPSSYVGSNVARNTAGDISYDWETGKVSAPSGYYAADATYNIPESLSKPTPYIEFEPATGLIKASTTYDEDHCGYFSTGTQSAQLQLPTVATSTITPTESRQLAVGMGNYVTGPVYVGAIDSSYVGSSITRRSSADLTASGSAVTAPAGYYSADASKTIPDATLKLSDAVINLDGSIEAEVKATSGGYVSQGNHYLTVEDVVTMKGAQTYYPSSSDQSISEWQYLIGAQTIKGVTYSGLDASNIKKDVVVQVGDSTDPDRIVSVTGTYEGGGGGDTPETKEKDVVIIDYDGTRLYSYTQEEFLALSALPANPTHTGLTSQGWNWTLADAKAHVQSYKYLVIGQSYITDDGKTRLYVTIDESNPSKSATVVFKSTPTNNTTIDWGDGTTSVGSPNNYGAKHTYDAYGDYVITLTVNSGTIALGYNGSNYSIGGISSTNPETLTAIRKIELGANISEIYRQCFTNLLNLETITIPLGVGDMRNSNGSYFNQSMSLKAVVIPSGCNCISKNFANDSGVRYVSIPKQTREITTTLTEMFTRARHLRMLTLPEVAVSSGATINLATQANALRRVTVPFTGTVAIGGTFIRDCFNLPEVTVPADVVSIADYAFYGCWGLRKLHMRPTTPPTLANTRAFQGLMKQNGRKIYVPYSADHSILEAYKTASNWSSFASNMEEEPND